MSISLSAIILFNAIRRLVLELILYSIPNSFNAPWLSRSNRPVYLNSIFLSGNCFWISTVKELVDINVLGEPKPEINSSSGSSKTVSVDSVNESAFPKLIFSCFKYCVIILKSEMGENSISKLYW